MDMWEVQATEIQKDGCWGAREMATAFKNFYLKSLFYNLKRKEPKIGEGRLRCIWVPDRNVESQNQPSDSQLHPWTFQLQELETVLSDSLSWIFC